MIDFKDRQPTAPGRRKLTHADNSAEYVTLEFADEPTAVGTPLNRATFMALQGFQNEQTTITKENKDVTKITSRNKDEEVSTSTITKTANGYVIAESFVGRSGIEIKKTTTIAKQGNTYVIGGELNE